MRVDGGFGPVLDGAGVPWARCSPGGLVAAAGRRSVWYPSPACPADPDHGLQDCIDSVTDGSTVILTNEINQDNGAHITKSLTLKASSRSLPPVLTYISVSYDAANSPSAMDITVQDIRVRFLAKVDLGGGSGHRVAAFAAESARAVPNAQGVEVATTVPASVTIEGSYIRRATGMATEALGLVASDPRGKVDFRVTGSRITSHRDPTPGKASA